jgi:hypothetical protein
LSETAICLLLLLRNVVSVGSVGLPVALFDKRFAYVRKANSHRLLEAVALVVVLFWTVWTDLPETKSVANFDGDNCIELDQHLTEIEREPIWLIVDQGDEDPRPRVESTRTFLHRNPGGRRWCN